MTLALPKATGLPVIDIAFFCRVRRLALIAAGKLDLRPKPLGATVFLRPIGLLITVPTTDVKFDVLSTSSPMLLAIKERVGLLINFSVRASYFLTQASIMDGSSIKPASIRQRDLMK